VRAGGKTLTLLGMPRTFPILRSLAEGPRDRLELRRDTGLPSRSTLRSDLQTLEEIGAVAKNADCPSGRSGYELTHVGQELRTVAIHLNRWLTRAPDGPLELGTAPAKAAVKGLVDGWSARMLAPLADEPLSLTELDRRVNTASYPTLERRLETMRLARQVDAKVEASNARGGTPYMVTGWLRRGVGPLIAAAQWEERNDLDGATPMAHREIESIVKLINPLLNMPSHLSAVLHFALRVRKGKPQRRPTSAIRIDDGEIELCDVRPNRKPDASVSAPRETWFSTLIDLDTRGLRVKGDRKLVMTLFNRAHQTLISHSSDETEAPAAALRS
jgi:DNA-binding HxlR family transcriptional regulator